MKVLKPRLILADNNYIDLEEEHIEAVKKALTSYQKFVSVADALVNTNYIIALLYIDVDKEEN